MTLEEAKAVVLASYPNAVCEYRQAFEYVGRYVVTDGGTFARSAWARLTLRSTQTGWTWRRVTSLSPTHKRPTPGSRPGCWIGRGKWRRKWRGNRGRRGRSEQRTKREILEARKGHGACCQRNAEYRSCSCYDEAVFAVGDRVFEVIGSSRVYGEVRMAGQTRDGMQFVGVELDGFEERLFLMEARDVTLATWQKEEANDE